VQNFVAVGQTIAEIWRFFDFLKMAAVRHLGFVMRVFGPPITEGIWWSFSLSKIWLESIQYFWYYASFNNFFNLGLKTPIHAPKIVFEGQNRGRGGTILTQTNSLLLLGVVTSLSQNRSRNATARVHTDRQRDTRTDTNKLIYNLSHAVCYSCAADKKLCLPFVQFWLNFLSVWCYCL